VRASVQYKEWNESLKEEEGRESDPSSGVAMVEAL